MEKLRNLEFDAETLFISKIKHRLPSNLLLFKDSGWGTWAIKSSRCIFMCPTVHIEHGSFHIYRQMDIELGKQVAKIFPEIKVYAHADAIL